MMIGYNTDSCLLRIFSIRSYPSRVRDLEEGGLYGAVRRMFPWNGRCFDSVLIRLATVTLASLHHMELPDARRLCPGPSNQIPVY